MWICAARRAKKSFRRTKTDKPEVKVDDLLTLKMKDADVSISLSNTKLASDFLFPRHWSTHPRFFLIKPYRHPHQHLPPPENHDLPLKPSHLFFWNEFTRLLKYPDNPRSSPSNALARTSTSSPEWQIIPISQARSGIILIWEYWSTQITVKTLLQSAD